MLKQLNVDPKHTPELVVNKADIKLTLGIKQVLIFDSVPVNTLI